jgi:transcriptional regulator with XRE-family HTH domain
MMVFVSNRERRIARAEWLIERDLREAGANLRDARLVAGLTLDSVAHAIGSSASSVLRVERGTQPGPRPVTLAAHAAAVGLRARIRLYPEGPPIRDAAQVALIREFRARLHPDIGFTLESPAIEVPGANDVRAFDALLTIGACRCGVELYTRFHDCQAQLRAALVKQRDAGVDRLLVVVKATHANRRAVAAAADLIATTLPLGTRQTMRALAAARDPGANGLVML